MDELPKLMADENMRSFRLEVSISWATFNKLWVAICSLLNTPSNEILLDEGMNGHPEFESKMLEMIEDILDTGFFAPTSRGSWTTATTGGKEWYVIPLQSRQLLTGVSISRYLRSVAAHAADCITRQIPEGVFSQSVEVRKVSGWLLHQPAGWDEVCIQYPAPSAFANLG